MALLNLISASYLMSMSTQSQIDYELTYVSDGLPQQPSNIFSTASDVNHIISSYPSTSDCISDCSDNSNCLGYVEFNEPLRCVTLNNLGTVATTESMALSFTKYTRYDLRDKHTLEGYFWYSNEEHGIGQQHTVYIDMNHNGEYDEGEPVNTTIDNDFSFHNLSTGSYMVREIPTDSCTQLLPGTWGYHLMPANGDPNYVNSVVQFYHAGHPAPVNFTGGIIMDPDAGTYVDNPEAPANYILDYSPFTFLSFLPEDGIVLTFLNEVIEDGEGNDIKIHVLGTSTTNAHVSVSQNNIDYTTIGILDDSTNEFDLGNTTFSGKVAFVKLHFYNEDGNNDVRHIIGVEGTSITDYFSAPYAIYATVPQVNPVVFVKDCVYHYGCYTYCIYTRVTFDSVDSCMVGCDLWEETGTCNCPEYNTTDVPFYGSDYQEDQCFDGCSYKIQHEVYPDYSVLMHASGRPDHVTSTVNCIEYDVSGLSPNGCIMDAIDSCSRQPSCNALSLDNHMHGHLYSDHQFVIEENSYFLMKNQENSSLERFTTATSTPTTSVSSTPSTSASTTPSTSASTTPTTSVSSTPSTSVSSTPSSSVSSTPSTSASTTPTSTPTIQQEEVAAVSATSAALIAVGTLFGLLVLSVLVLYIVQRNRRHAEAMRKLEDSKRQQQFINPVYNTGRKISGSSLVSNGNYPSVYLDVAPEGSTFMESPIPGSPKYFVPSPSRSISPSRSTSPVKIETNV